MRYLLKILLVTFAAPLFADDLKDGINAFEKGNLNKAFNLFTPLAEGGNAEAQTYLAFIHEDANNVKEAVYWYELGAEGGNPYAQLNLAMMYAQGINGVTKDIKHAGKLYRQAAEQGLAQAQNNLGSLYYNGSGVKKNYAEALKWYRLSARQGNAEAAINLSAIYANGHGVEADYVKAFIWANYGEVWGLEKVGKLNREIVEQKLSEEDKALAYRLIQKCLSSNGNDCDF